MNITSRVLSAGWASAVALVIFVSISPLRGQGAGYGTVSGRVLDPKGRPVSGAELAAEVIGSGAIHVGYVPWADSGAGGKFHFAHLPYGRYHIAGGKPSAGYPPGIWAETYGTSRAPIVALSAAHRAATIVVHIFKAGLLRLKILDAETGEGLPDVGLLAPGMRWETNVPAKRILAGSLDPGSTLFIPADRKVDVRISARGFHSWHGSFRLAPGETEPVTIRLRPLRPGAPLLTLADLPAILNTGTRLGDLANVYAARLGPGAIPDLMKAAANENDASQRATALDIARIMLQFDRPGEQPLTAAEHAELSKVVRAGLHDVARTNQIEAIRAVGMLGNPEDLPILRQFAASRVPRLAEAAKAALQNFGKSDVRWER